MLEGVDMTHGALLRRVRNRRQGVPDPRSPTNGAVEHGRDHADRDVAAGSAVAASLRSGFECLRPIASSGPRMHRPRRHDHGDFAGDQLI